MTRNVVILLAVLVAFAMGCTDESSPSNYDPNWDSTGPISEGKADGIFDIVPNLVFDEAVTGDVGAARVEMYRLELQRTDKVQIDMTVTSGDLNPHISFFLGTSTYIRSDSWERPGDTLTKVYTAESAGSYLVVARAYHEEGAGDYSLVARCLGGPCAGEFPEPEEEELSNVDVAACIKLARECAFGQLDAVTDAASADAVFASCLETVDLYGVSCASACDWTNPDEYEDETSDYLCNSIKDGIVFYAGQDAACTEKLSDCLSECHSYGEWSNMDALFDTEESLCWANGFNGTCDSYARDTEACGGTLPADSAIECTQLCYSTMGAFTDDLDSMCSYDSDCDSYCDVDLALAAEVCGVLTAATETCFYDWIDENDAWICEGALEDALP